MTPSTLARRALASAQTIVPAADHGVCILAYHLIGGGTPSPVDLPRDAFREQMSWLAASGMVRPLPELLEGELPRGLAVVLTFDDAFANFADVVLPVLEDMELAATLYVPTGFVDGSHPSPLTGCALPALSWHALRQLAQHPLVHIGSHSHAHVDLRGLPAGEREADLVRSRHRLEDELGIEVSDYCYPQAKWSRATERDVGLHYRSAAIAGGRVNRFINALRLERKPIRRDCAVPFDEVVRAEWLVEERIADPIRRLRGTAGRLLHR